jgi:hypothetical protein
MADFIQSTFIQRDKKDTIIADVYEGTKEAISAYSDAISKNFTSISNEVTSLFKEASNVKQFLKSIDFNKPLFGLKVDDAINALKGLGIDKGTIDTLKSLYDDHSLSNITSVLAGMTGVSIIGEIGDFYADVKDMNIKNLSDFIDLTNKLTGLGLKIDGLGNLSETLGFVIDMADKWGLTIIADKIIEKYKNDPKFKETMVNQLEVYVVTGNLTMINICLNAGISPSDARIRCPNAENQILRGYSIPSNIELHQYKDEGIKLIDTINRFANAFTKVQVAHVNGSPYMSDNLNLLNNTSRDSLTVLNSCNSPIYLPALIASGYPEVDMYGGSVGLYKV